MLARSSSQACHNHRINTQSKTCPRESRKRQMQEAHGSRYCGSPRSNSEWLDHPLPTYPKASSIQRPKEVHRVAQHLYQCLLGRPHKHVTITGSIRKARPAPARLERSKCSRHKALGTAEVHGAIQSGWTASCFRNMCVTLITNRMNAKFGAGNLCEVAPGQLPDQRRSSRIKGLEPGSSRITD